MAEEIRRIRVEGEIDTNKRTIYLPPTDCDTTQQAREALDEFLAEIEEAP